MKKHIALLLALVLVLSMFAGCAKSEAPAAEPAEDASDAPADSSEPAAEPERQMKDTLTVALGEEPISFDPPNAMNQFVFGYVGQNIYDALVRPNDDGTFRPGLATSWEMLDDMTIKFNLREDVVFHNGEKFTSEDVLYSFERCAVAPTSKGMWAHFDIANSETPDDYTFILKMYEPFASALSYLGGGRGNIIDKTTMEAIGEDEYARMPIGTGPFSMVEWQTGLDISMKRNDNYWGTKSSYENLVFKIVLEDASRAIELETGGVDMVLGIADSDINILKEAEGVDVIMGPSYRYTCLTMSMKDETLKNQKLREALTYAIDKEALVNAVYGVTAEAATGLIPATVPYYKDQEPNPYDVELAKQLLTEAGYPDGLTLKMVVKPTSEFVNSAEAIQNMWGQIGVNVELFTMERSIYLAQGNEYQIAIRSGNADIVPHVLIIYDSAFGDRMQPNDDYIDSQLKAASIIYDDDQRREIYGELQDYIWDLHYSMPIAYSYNVIGISDNVENFEYRPNFAFNLAELDVYED